MYSLTGSSEMGVKCHGSFNQIMGIFFSKSGPGLPTTSCCVARGLRMVTVVSLYPVRAEPALNMRTRRPQYCSSGLEQDEIKHCMELVERAVVCANWLASTARAELPRFKEFMMWLRFGELSI
jgi:hypothetical protein